MPGEAGNMTSLLRLQAVSKAQAQLIEVSALHCIVAWWCCAVCRRLNMGSHMLAYMPAQLYQMKLAMFGMVAEDTHAAIVSREEPAGQKASLNFVNTQGRCARALHSQALLSRGSDSMGETTPKR